MNCHEITTLLHFIFSVCSLQKALFIHTGLNCVEDRETGGLLLDPLNKRFIHYISILRQLGWSFFFLLWFHWKLLVIKQLWSIYLSIYLWYQKQWTSCFRIKWTPIHSSLEKSSIFKVNLLSWEMRKYKEVWCMNVKQDLWSSLFWLPHHCLLILNKCQLLPATIYLLKKAYMLIWISTTGFVPGSVQNLIQTSFHVMHTALKYFLHFIDVKTEFKRSYISSSRSQSKWWKHNGNSDTITPKP